MLHCYVEELQMILRKTSPENYIEIDMLWYIVLQLQEDFITHTLRYKIYDIYQYETLNKGLVKKLYN